MEFWALCSSAHCFLWASVCSSVKWGDAPSRLRGDVCGSRVPGGPAPIEDPPGGAHSVCGSAWAPGCQGRHTSPAGRINGVNSTGAGGGSEGSGSEGWRGSQASWRTRANGDSHRPRLPAGSTGRVNGVQLSRCFRTQLCGFPAPLLPQGQTLSYHLRWSQSLSGNTGQAGAAQRGCKPRTEHRTRSTQG